MTLSSDQGRHEVHAPIPIRRIELGFDPAVGTRDYYGDDPHMTMVLNALSTFFPEGERYFVESVKYFRDRIDDPQLTREIAAFAGQEAMHARQHDLFNAILTQQGLASARFGERVAKTLLKRARRAFSKKGQLAATCGLEHFTAILAEQILRDDAHRAMFREPARGLWLWHALEESEHKTVAFDVYQAVDGSYWRRVGVMIPTSVFFFAATSAVYFAMLKERGLLSDVKGIFRVVDYLWLRRGLFRSLIPSYLSYFRPGFHPNDHDARELVANWSEQLFGESGAMRAQLKQVRVPPGSVL